MHSDPNHARLPVRIAAGLDQLRLETLSDPARDYQSTAPWYAALVEAALPPGASAELVLCGAPGHETVAWPMLRNAGRLQSLTCPYTTLYQPIIASRLESDDLRRAGHAFGSVCRREATVTLEALDADSPAMPHLLTGVREAGVWTLRYANFASWFQPVAGLGWDEYLQTREGSLRETIRRKQRAWRRDGTAHFQVITSPGEVETGIMAYEDVYARSWKEPEPFPLFSAALLRGAAAAGSLRLGLLRRGGQPIAAQYWIVHAGRATVLKLAHDEAHRALSPGTVLTAHMIRTLLEQDHVAELDFGRGDDPYKSSWAGQRRTRIGFVLANPRRRAGLAAIVRHFGGNMRRGFRRLREM